MTLPWPLPPIPALRAAAWRRGSPAARDQDARGGTADCRVARAPRNHGGWVALVLVALFFATPAFAVSSPAEMLPNRAMELRAEHIGHELRCLVCQNESIEESDADLARDLRKIIREHVVAGQSDRQIVAWMVARYGNFVRLRPPYDWATLALWGSPVAFLLVGSTAAFLGWRQRRPGPAPLSAAEREKLSELLHP